jgi:PAS domain S-box-containing protein
VATRHRSHTQLRRYPFSTSRDDPPTPAPDNEMTGVPDAFMRAQVADEVEFDSTTRMGALMNRHDWSTAALPLPERWPQRLWALVDLMLASPMPTFIAWGGDLGVLYNDASIALIGERHPLLLGSPLEVAWPELWGDIRPLVDRVLAGESILVENQRLTLHRTSDDTDLEAWFHLSYTPVRDSDGTIQGVYCTLQDTTHQVVAERQRAIALARLQQLFDQAPGFMAVTQGPEHTFELSNEAYSRLVGHRDLIGLPVEDALPEVSGQGYLALLDQVYRSGEAFVGRRMQVQLQSPEGDHEDRYVDFVYQPIRAGDGRVSGIFIQGSDVTGQERLEQQLRESEAKFRTITDAMPQMVWSTRPDGYHDYFNQRWYDYTGVAQGSTDGDAWTRIFHPADHARTQVAWQHSLETGEPYEIEYRLRHRSGEYRWVLGRALAVRDEQGRITRWMGTCTDIHEQVMAREVLRREARRKDEFLAMLAHELRNPLAPIRAAAAVLPAAAGDGERTVQLAQVITRQVQHMTRLVDDLLDVSRVTRGLVKLDLHVDDLKAVATSAIEQVRPLIEDRGHVLTTWMTPDPVPVRADRTRLVQVVANLLNNAAKYTPDGGRIDLRVTSGEGEAVLVVRDNGSGIDAQLLPRVFDLFTQGARDPGRSQGGLGIGLALARSITSMHGGRIAGASEGRGRGSEFTLCLPLAKPGKGTPPTAAVEQPETMQANSRCHVIVVDDNVDAARTIALALEIAGHDVAVHHDAAAVLAASAVHPAKVYIIDIGLPDMPGYELAQALRREPRTRDAVLIALTGYGRAEDRARSIEAGFDRHLVKPVDVEELRRTIDGLLSPPAT